jgi:hypothetical protein
MMDGMERRHFFSVFFFCLTCDEAVKIIQAVLFFTAADKSEPQMFRVALTRSVEMQTTGT